MRDKRNQTIRCHSCGLEVLLRGGDHEGWKGVQVRPNDAESFVWFCPKDICRQAFGSTMEAAQRNWAEGVADDEEEA